MEMVEISSREDKFKDSWKNKHDVRDVYVQIWRLIRVLIWFDRLTWFTPSHLLSKRKSLGCLRLLTFLLVWPDRNLFQIDSFI